MKIDAYNHIITPKFHELRLKRAPGPMASALDARMPKLPALWDLEARFRIMDQHEDYVQILTMGNPPPEVMAGPEEAAELARVGNDEMAELVAKYPDRFAGAISVLPMNDIEAALREIDRTVGEMGFRGVQIFTHVAGSPLDNSLEPIFQKMVEYDLPILLHPGRSAHFADYPSQDKSHYDIWHIFGWTFDSTAAMTHLVFTGVFDRFPNIKIVTHHLGGLVPYLEGRIEDGFTKMAINSPEGKAIVERLQRPPREYFPMFHADSATNGSVRGLECGIPFFGVDQVLFASDMPFDEEGGARYVRINLQSMEKLDRSEEDKKKIYEENARRVFRLTA